MKIKKELWFGFGLMAIILSALLFMIISVPKLQSGHYGLIMLALVVVAIMLGFPTAFTLMGMGMIFTFLAYDFSVDKTLTLMVQSAFKVMGNDVLISIPLFVFMGYLVERANLIDKLFKSLHLALARVPGSLAVATLVTCAIFATATGIVGAVVTLMGLLALPQMLKAGYDIKLSAGVITAGGCLGILIPPSVMLIVYGATAGVSVVQLYAGAFFPGLMLAGLYILYVIIVAKIKPSLAPPLTTEQRFVPLPAPTAVVSKQYSNIALPALVSALKGSRNEAFSTQYVLKQLGITLIPAIVFALAAWGSYNMATKAKVVDAPVVASAGGVSEPTGGDAPAAKEASSGGLQEPTGSTAASTASNASGIQEPPGSSSAPAASSGVQEPPSSGVQEPGAAKSAGSSTTTSNPAPAAKQAAGAGYWIGFGVGLACLLGFYALLSFQRLEVFKMLLASFFPLLVLILSVLGSIVMGLATPTEAAAVGAFGGFLLAAAYRQLNMRVIKESVFLTAKTSAMVCWLFVGSAIFSAAFALLGGQDLVEKWVLSMNLTKTEFLLLSQVIIFVLGWPLEWTEIIVIFMPIFIPLLDDFGVDPLFFGLLVALNLQTAFLSPPVAMAAFYLKGVSPPHVTLNQIFAGMLPFMGIQIFAIFLLYQFPQIGMWLPQVLYK